MKKSNIQTSYIKKPDTIENSGIDADLGKGAKVTNSFKDNVNSPIKIR